MLNIFFFKLDDVFSDVFGKAASAITARLLENNQPFDVTPYLTKGIKASLEEIQAAVDGAMCANQAEKLRIIRSHMESLELCKNLQYPKKNEPYNVELYRQSDKHFPQFGSSFNHLE